MIKDMILFYHKDKIINKDKDKIINHKDNTRRRVVDEEIWTSLETTIPEAEFIAVEKPKHASQENPKHTSLENQEKIKKALDAVK